jgi:acyl-CoA thioester hydrolase
MEIKMENDYNLRVYYEDTDTGGVVYHSIYLNFIERARSEIFFRNGISPIDNEFHFVVKEINAKFLKPAKLGDELKIETNVIKIKNASVKLHQIINFKENPEIKVFEAIVDLVCLKGDKISKIPLKFENIFNQYYEKY